MYMFVNIQQSLSMPNENTAELITKNARKFGDHFWRAG